MTGPASRLAGIESMRDHALQQVDELRNQLLAYHKNVVMKTFNVVEDKDASVQSTQNEIPQSDQLHWHEEKQELQERLQQALHRNEELAMEMAQSRLQYEIHQIVSATFLVEK
jgi:hypothetical protein